MFEQYLDIPDNGRHKKNRELLFNYQNDINELSALFTEDDLFELCTFKDNSGKIIMKEVPDFVEILGNSVNSAKQLNFFQHVPLLKKWLTLQSQEYDQLSIKIYAPQSPRQNKIPEAKSIEIERFIENLICNHNLFPKSLLSEFIQTLYKLSEPEYHYSTILFDISDDIFYKKFVRTNDVYTRKIISHLQSAQWINNIPGIKDLHYHQQSLLIFTKFCSDFYFPFVCKTLEDIQCKGIVVNEYLNYTSMIELIFLALLPFNVTSTYIKKFSYNFKLTSPDDFIVRKIINFKKQNLSGYLKDTAQLLNKTYIYIALLLNPDWCPSAKEIIKFLEGDHKNIEGCFQTWGSKVSLVSQINNITALRKENYFENFLKRVLDGHQ